MSMGMADEQLLHESHNIFHHSFAGLCPRNLLNQALAFRVRKHPVRKEKHEQVTSPLLGLSAV